MKILVTTQVYENYGTHDWDGKGECPQYWKAKGGSEYYVAQISVQEAAILGQKGLAAIVYAACAVHIAINNEYFQEFVLNWELVDDDHITEYEKEQIEFGETDIVRPKVTYA